MEEKLICKNDSFELKIFFLVSTKLFSVPKAPLQMQGPTAMRFGVIDRHCHNNVVSTSQHAKLSAAATEPPLPHKHTHISHSNMADCGCGLPPMLWFLVKHNLAGRWSAWQHHANYNKLRHHTKQCRIARYAILYSTARQQRDYNKITLSCTLSLTH